MSTDLAPFPDIEAALLDLLEDLAGDPTNVGTSTPADLQTRALFIQVVRFGGGDDRFSDTARIDVSVFGPSRAVVKPAAELVRQRLLAAPHVVSGTVIDTVTTDTAPAEVPWDDPQVRRWLASYRVTARR